MDPLGFGDITIYFTEGLRRRWPSPLAHEWLAAYPQIFDEDDPRLALSQPSKHFFEWLAAMNLLHRYGVFCLVEKYAYKNHSRKVQILSRLLGDFERAFVLSLRRTRHVQPPDLLVYTPNLASFCFAEVKGP